MLVILRLKNKAPFCLLVTGEEGNKSILSNSVKLHFFFYFVIFMKLISTSMKKSMLRKLKNKDGIIKACKLISAPDLKFRKIINLTVHSKVVMFYCNKNNNLEYPISLKQQCRHHSVYHIGKWLIY